MNNKPKIEEIYQELKKTYIELKTKKGIYIQLFGPVKFPLFVNENLKSTFKWYVWNVSETSLEFEQLLHSLKKMGGDRNYNTILTYGDFENSKNPLVRVHSCCFTGDVLYSSRCDCGKQLEKAIELIVENKSGAIAYLSNHEGRGIGLFAKAITHQIQDVYKFDTYESCNIINFGEEERTFEDLGTIINYFRNDKGVNLLSNNPEKINQLIKSGVKINSIHSLDGFENDDNINVLNQKKKRAEKIAKNYK